MVGIKTITVPVGLGGGSLLQAANRSRNQMMSYMIGTPEGRTVVIDGGFRCKEDGEHLSSLIRQRGGKVDDWFLTHGHDDHFGALLWMMEQSESLDFSVGTVWADLPPAEWFLEVERGAYYESVCALLEGFIRHRLPVQRLRCGQRIPCGGITVEVIKASEYECCDNINDSSLVLRVHFPERDVLFLGDLGAAGGNRLLETCPPEKLRCAIVQMAHHGQNGVDRGFYETVQPEICLYPTPDWLWENDLGGGKGTGPFATLITRRWMEELGVKLSCPGAFGDYLLL